MLFLHCLSLLFYDTIIIYICRQLLPRIYIADLIGAKLKKGGLSGNIPCYFLSAYIFLNGSFHNLLILFYLLIFAIGVFMSEIYLTPYTLNLPFIFFRF